MTVELVPTRLDEREIFIANLQAAFRRADGTDKFRNEDLPRFFDRTNAALFNILADKNVVGGAVLIINHETQRNKLSLFFVNADSRNQGIGLAAWRVIEKLFPATRVWETSTSWLDKRNLHFYLNKCCFNAVSIYSSRHPIQYTDKEIYLALEKVMR
ncbi:MAG: GNAT family N-acetyltransferase [Selenomonadaceae bacterium]|nr:GNAT family N-acetyltransferase [Selenomonadaceae bacterium]